MKLPPPDNRGIGGPGFPRPERKREDPFAAMMKGGVNLAMGQDLSNYKNPEKHKHRWIIVGNYLVTEENMVELKEAVERLKAAAEAGTEPAENITLHYGPDTLIAMEGPGCAKCGMIWTAPGAGYGFACEVSDDDYDADAVVTPPPGSVKAPKIQLPGE